MTGLVNRLVKNELLSVGGPALGMLCEQYRLHARAMRAVFVRATAAAADPDDRCVTIAGSRADSVRYPSSSKVRFFLSMW